MKSALKILAAVVAVVALLILVAAIAVPLVVDPNDHKDRVVALVKEHTGRELRIGGDIAVSVFPWLGLKVSNVELANAEGFTDPRFAELDELSVRVKLLPLLGKRVEMDMVTLQGLVLHLERNAEGKGNWEDLLASTEEAKAAPAAAAEEGSPLAALALGGVDVRDAEVHWRDGVTGQSYVVEGLSARTGALVEGKPVDVETAFKLSGEAIGLEGQTQATGRLSFSPAQNLIRVDELAMKADLSGNRLPGGRAVIEASGDLLFKTAEAQLTVPNFKVRASGITLADFKSDTTLTGQLSADMVQQLYLLNGLRITSELAGTSGKGERVVLELISELEANLARQRLNANSFTLNVSELDISGLDGKLAVNGVLSGDLARSLFVLTDLKASGVLAGAPLGEATLTYETNGSLNADLDNRRYQARDLRFEGTLSGERIPGKQIPIQVVGEVAVDDAKGTLTATNVNVTLAGVSGAGEITASWLAKQPTVRGTLSVAEFNPRRVLEDLGQPLPKASKGKSLERASLEAEFALDKDGFGVAPLVLELDDSRMNGSLKLAPANLDKASFDIILDRLDVDRYLSLAAAESSEQTAQAPTTPPAGPAAAGALAFPAQRLRALDLDGRIRVGKLSIKGARYADVDASLKAKDGNVQLAPLKAKLYGGNFDGSVALDARTDSPVIKIENRLGGVRLDKLLADLGVDSGDFKMRGASDVTVSAVVINDSKAKSFLVDDFRLNARLADESFLDGMLDVGLQSVLLLDPQRDTLRTESLQLTVGEARVQGKMTVSQLSSDPRLAGTLKAEPFNARRVLRQVLQGPVETADPKALASASLSASVIASRDGVSIDALAMKVDETSAEGSLGIKDFDAPGLRFDLKVDDIDLDRYLPRSRGRGKKSDKKASAGTPGGAVTVLPADTIRELNLDGQVRIGKLKVNNVKLEDVRVTAKGKDGELRVQPLSAGLYEGTFEGAVYVDARGKHPRIEVEEKLQGVQVASLLADLEGTAVMSGRTDLSARLSAVGSDNEALKRSLTGTASFAVTNGAVRGVDLLGQICTALAAVNLRKIRKEDVFVGLLRLAAKPEAGGGSPTNFKELTGSVQVEKGVARNEDLKLQSSLLTLQGKGTFNLVTTNLDYEAIAELARTTEGAFSSCVKELEGIPIPVRITGKPGSIETAAQLTGGVLQALRAREAARRAPEQPTTTGTQGALTTLEPTPDQAAKSKEDRAEKPRDPEEQLKGAVEDLLKQQLRNIFGQ